MFDGVEKGAVVAVAMSGGVDSSTTAAVLKREGFEVVGMTMRLPGLERFADSPGGCCGIRGVEDARAVAEAIGFPFYAIDYEAEFTEKVIGPFCKEYLSGRTPNPCIACNEIMKFELLLDRARRLGASYLATGHYARRAYDNDVGRYTLRRGVDAGKDQSYFLYSMTQAHIERVIFPLGGFEKEEVRAMAREFALPVCEKEESQDICFAPDGDYARIVEKTCPGAAVPGPVFDTQGNEIGAHRGIIHHTVGQRKGLGIAADAPLYVIEIDAGRNALIVGKEEETFAKGCVTERVNWLSIAAPTEPIDVRAKIRYGSQAVDALVTPQTDGASVVEFTEPQKSVAPGQAAVFYKGDLVLGGGVIASAVRD